MSTMQVPGFRAENNDCLAAGCWAENDDGSKLVVEMIDGERVCFQAIRPDGEFAIALMALDEFMAKMSDTEWTWHDKTPSPVPVCGTLATVNAGMDNVVELRTTAAGRALLVAA